MKQISRKDWENYIKALSGLSQKAAQIMQAFAEQNGLEDRDALIRMQYALATKYGEAAASLACQMYDAVAEASGAMVPPAEPAETATYKEAAIAVNGSLKQSPSGKVLPQTTDRLVKQAAADTTLKNALRDGAQFAWVPNGDTCAFCLTLASRGWQYASKKTIQGGHADHIHANCDCTFAIRFDNSTTVAGYDPDKYKRMYYDAGNTPKERLNTMRRIHYAENRDRINAQKRAAYMRRILGRDGLAKIAKPSIESRHSVGKPPGVALFGDTLSGKQQKLLSHLKVYNDRIIIDKRSVSMKDLAAITAHENVEFAMFTKNNKRLIIRGGRNDVDVNENKMKELARQGYKWSGHTHPVTNPKELLPSEGDRAVLKASGKKRSAVYSSTGRKYIFGINEDDDLGYR